jgi:hypothetical protein
MDELARQLAEQDWQVLVGRCWEHRGAPAYWPWIQVVRAAGTALRTGAGLMTLGAIGFIGYGLIFFVRNFTDSFLELGIGPGEVSVGRQQIEAFSPSLAHYISHLHIALTAFMAATGLATGFLAWFGVRQGRRWAWVGAVAAPVLGIAVALPAHYPYNLDTGGHLGLAYLVTAIFVVGALLSLTALTGRSRSTSGGRWMSSTGARA